MNINKNNLLQDVKREVLAEISNTGYGSNPNYSSNYSPNYNSNYSLNHNSNYSPNHSYSPNYNTGQGFSGFRNFNPANFNDFSPYPNNHTYEIMKESVKNEVLGEIQAQQTQHLANMYGFDRILSDQKIQQMVDGRYRTLENMKADLKKELQAIQKMENQRTPDPYIRQVANSLVQEARQQGVPLDQVMQNLDQRSPSVTGFMGRVSSMLNTGQRKGFLYGLGAAFLINLVWPSARNNLHSVAVRTMEEGMSLANRAKSFVGGRHDSEMVSFDDFDVEPQGPHRPPEVDILKQ